LDHGHVPCEIEDEARKKTVFSPLSGSGKRVSLYIARMGHFCLTQIRVEPKENEMKRLSFVLVPVTVVLCLLCPCLATADPIPIIQYQAFDLPDLVSGQDLWKYEYFLSYATADKFEQDQGFAIFFDYGLYSDLQDTPPPVTDWYPILVYKPNPVMFWLGEYDAVAATDDPSLANPFSVTFVWLGGPGAAPGAQPFTLYEWDFSDPEFPAGREIGSGETRGQTPNAIPEPGTILLLMSGLAALAMVYRKNR
jgi:hypothetical protein